MKIANYINYGMCIYENKLSCNDKYKLGDVVINDDKFIGVIIQIHSRSEFRTDMFGNTSDSETRIASDEEINQYRPNILKEGKFKH